MPQNHTSLRLRVLALESRMRILEGLLLGDSQISTSASASRLQVPADFAIMERLARVEKALGLSPEPIKTIRLEDR